METSAESKRESVVQAISDWMAEPFLFLRLFVKLKEHLLAKSLRAIRKGQPQWTELIRPLVGTRLTRMEWIKLIPTHRC